MSALAGLYPPITTPFTPDDRLALAELERNLAHWIAAPLDGVVMPGSNSESVFLTREERLELWRVCANLLKNSGKRLIAGTGAETTAETIALTEEAAKLGAAATLVLPPFFYKAALTPEALITHYRAVADASPIPVLLYNVPAFTGIDFVPAIFMDLAQHPQIVGVKDSSSNVVKMAGVLAAYPDFQVFAGTGSALLPFMSLGAVGGIMGLANVTSEPLRAIVDAFHAGDMASARRHQLSVAALNEAVTARYGVAGLKYAMDRVGIYGGPVRRPLLPLNAAGRADIDRLLAALGLGVAA